MLEHLRMQELEQRVDRDIEKELRNEYELIKQKKSKLPANARRELVDYFEKKVNNK